MMNKGLDNGQDLPHELLMVWHTCIQAVKYYIDCTIRIIMIVLREIHCLDLRMGVI